MADIFSTTDVELHDANGNPVAVIDDNGIKRLAVDTKLTGVSLGAIVNEANIFRFKIHDITSKQEVTIDTYTVPAGKTFRLTAFQVNADHPLAIDINLKVNGSTKIKFYLDPSFGISQNEFICTPTIFATAGQVVTITIEPTMPRGEVNAILAGIEL